ncbi:uncharacterized protein LOC129723163 [Wyeomyia smithii]|uniref:uncharacterized protein LOC129723163 n=1 Tax=Wyeomyia smithii TaxID=174621 RepID=UPI002467E9AD|nr:uncharacterized protein LOC129723163 [Wyeomyia smithii]
MNGPFARGSLTCANICKYINSQCTTSNTRAIIMEKPLFFVATLLSLSAAQYENSFAATLGCSQYNAVGGYEADHPYFAISNFRNVFSTTNVTRIRLGILGTNDGIIRLAPAEYPYDETEMHEIVLSGWANQRSVIRRYIRDSPDKVNATVELVNRASNGMLSSLKPLMISIEYYPSGTIKIVKDGNRRPLLQTQDRKLSFNNIGFCNWNVPVVFFFDCPVN